MLSFQKLLEEHNQVMLRLLDQQADLYRVAIDCTKAIRAGRKIMLFGNGGSAADAQHIAAEFVVKYKKPRQAIAAIALNTDVSVLTACANDFDFDTVFVRQIAALGQKGDVAIGISTSGKSRNVLRGLSMARDLGIKGVLLTSDLCEGPVDATYVLRAPTKTVARAQEAHTFLLHTLVEMVEEKLAI